MFNTLEGGKMFFHILRYLTVWRYKWRYEWLKKEGVRHFVQKGK